LSDLNSRLLYKWPLFQFTTSRGKDSTIRRGQLF